MGMTIAVRVRMSLQEETELREWSLSIDETSEFRNGIVTLCFLCSLLFNSRLSSQNPKTKSQKLKLPPNMMTTKIARAARSIASRAPPTNDGMTKAPAEAVNSADKVNTRKRRWGMVNSDKVLSFF